MEHNIAPIDFELLPPEILLHVISSVKAVDLLSFELVCKSWRSLFQNNEVLWKGVARREFDLNPTHKDVVKQAKKFAKINHNIRNCRCVCTVLAVSTMVQYKNFYLGYCSFNDKSVAVNWIQKRGSGSGEFDYSAHAALIDLKSRTVTIVHPNSDSNIVFYGPYLTQMAWNGYHVTISYSATKHAEITSKNQVVAGADIQSAQEMIQNEDLTLQHLIALPKLDTPVNAKDSVQFDLKIAIYDLENRKYRCEIKLDKFATRAYYYLMKSCVVFTGDKIYALQHETTKKLIEIDINKPHEHKESDMSSVPDKAVLTGVTESFVFGTATTTHVWCYNKNTKTVATYHCPNDVNVFDVKWYCGTLMAFQSYAIVFLDPYSSGPELQVIATLATDKIGNVQSRIYEDGKVILSSFYNSVKMLDFLHANDDVQLLAVTGDTKDDMTLHNIKAYQLTEKLAQILGTRGFISRYFAEGGTERYGIIFTKEKTGPKLPINVKQLDRDPEYNSPYFAMDMKPANTVMFGNTPHVVPKTLPSIHQVAVLFYERFDGENWRLSKCEDWTEALELLFSTSKCLVQ